MNRVKLPRRLIEDERKFMKDRDLTGAIRKFRQHSLYRAGTWATSYHFEDTHYIGHWRSPPDDY